MNERVSFTQMLWLCIVHVLYTVMAVTYKLLVSSSVKSMPYHK